jgi:hypothetical protein
MHSVNDVVKFELELLNVLHDEILVDETSLPGDRSGSL